MELKPVCPAAIPLAGPPASGPAVICGAALQERDRTDQISHGESASPLMTVQKDASVVLGFCCGKALPVLHPGQEPAHGHHTSCPLWEKEKERIWERKRMIQEPKRRGLSDAADAVLRDVERGDALEEWLAEEDDAPVS